MIKVFKNGDIKFPISKVSGIADKFYCHFFTQDKNNFIKKTSEDMSSDGYIKLNWTSLQLLEQGVLNVRVYNMTEDQEFADGEYNNTFVRTTPYYIVAEFPDASILTDIVDSIEQSIKDEADEREATDKALQDNIDEEEKKCKERYDDIQDALTYKVDKADYEIDKEENLQFHKEILAYVNDVRDIAEATDRNLEENYYTKAEVDEKIHSTGMDNYYTKDETDEKITEIENKIPDVSIYETKEDAAATYQVKGDYALKSDIPTVPTKVSELENDANYITKADIPEVDLSDYYKKDETYSKEEVDIQLATKVGMSVLDNYYDKTETDNLLIDKADKATTLDGYGITDGVKDISIVGSGNVITAASINKHTITLRKGTTALTEHQDISGKADKSDTLSGYGITDAYTKTEVDAKITEVDTKLATKQNKLTAGEGIAISEDDVISSTSQGMTEEQEFLVSGALADLNKKIEELQKQMGA